MKEKITNRIFGLDILRSLAIIIVVISHSNFNYISNIHILPLPDGVDLFFVLSGFLIGTIIIKIIEKNENFNIIGVFNFLIRRWFRTLPNYFLFLLINILLIYFGLIKGVLNKFAITYFVFFQNFYKPYDFLFWESWSLSIEEWFYLLFPLTLLGLFILTRYKVKAKRIILITIILFLLFPLIFRLFQANKSLDYDLYFRKLVLTRLDTIGYGLLGAYIHWYYYEFWRKFKNIFFVIGIILLFYLTTINLQILFFLKTTYISLIGLSIFFLLPKLESFKNEKIPLKPFQFISKISFSMYLIHIPLIQIFSNTFSFSNKYAAILIYIIFWILLILLSFFVYTFYEKPLMNIRERIKIKEYGSRKK